MSVSQLRAVQYAGGLVAGAWQGSELVGFCYGFPSFRPQLDPAPGLHSHMTAVVATARNVGIGRGLKWYQRRWCLERGISWVEWTFDPLRAANARLNLEHLGATVAEYLVDAYGPMADALNAGLHSDRLMARWQITHPGLDGLESRRASRPPPSVAATALTEGEAGGPAEPQLHLTDRAVTVRVPHDLGTLLAGTPTLATAWRLAVRGALVNYLGKGYRITRFVAGSYLLQAQRLPSETASHEQ
ncbi:MAG: hypothetical protein WD273_12375 [Trueperaceae bacterium]